MPTTSTEGLASRLVCGLMGLAALALAAGAAFHIVIAQSLASAERKAKTAQTLPFGETRYTLLDQAAAQANRAAALAPGSSQAYAVLARVRMLQSVGFGLDAPSLPLLQAAEAAGERASVRAPFDPAPMADLAAARDALRMAGEPSDGLEALALSYARAAIAPDLIDRRLALAGVLWGRLDADSKARVLTDVCATRRTPGGPQVIEAAIKSADPALVREIGVLEDDPACR